MNFPAIVPESAAASQRGRSGGMGRNGDEAV